MTDKKSQKAGTTTEKKVAENNSATSKAEQPFSPKQAPKTAKETPEKPETASNSPSSDLTKQKPVAKRRVGLVLFALWLLLVVLIAVGAWFGWGVWQKHSTRVQQLEAQLEEQSDRWNQALSQQSSLLTIQQQHLDTVGTELQQNQQIIQQRLDTHAQRLQTLSGSSRDSWMLEEVRYLLRLANQRQLTGGVSTGIIGLLNTADELLHELDLPDVFPIRDSIRKDILALQIAPKVDREGIYLTLSALIDHLDQLPPIPIGKLSEHQQKTQSSKQSASSTVSDWQSDLVENIKQAFGQLEKYIRIDQYDQPVEPVLSKAQQQLMAQNLRLMLEQAQIAMLREEQKIYYESLQKVIGWLDIHYAHFPEQPALIKQLKVVQQQNIVSVLPTISASLLRLNDYMQQRETLSPEVDASKQSSLPQASVNKGASQ